MPERQLGIKVLSVLHILSGILLALRALISTTRFQELQARLHATPILAIVLLAYLAVLALSSGVGMWRGKRWGWWLAAFFYMHSITRLVSYLPKIHAIAEQFELGVAGTNSLYTIAGLKILWSAVVLLYLFSVRVWTSFGLGKVKKLVAAAGLLGIAMLVGAF